MKVGVIGAGTMGQGIAKAFAQVEGYTVALCDIKQEWAEGGKNKIAAGYAKLVAKGKLDQAEVDRRMAAITAGLKEDLCADCDLIVEAAFEDMKVKQTTFGELDKICKPECIFASNTSSLSITEIGKGLTRPLIGMHFFNPADRMKLIEVIAGGLEAGEDPIEGAKRETAEETGYDVTSIKFLTTIICTPGYCEERIHLYFAELSESAHEQNQDPDENVHPLVLSEQEVEDGIRNGTIFDAKTLAAWACYNIDK